MQKNIGKEGSGADQFNVMRLAKELDDAGLAIDLFQITQEGDILLTFEDSLESQVDAVCAKHVPEPLPEEPSDLDIVKAEMVKLYDKQEEDKTELQLAVAEAVEMMVAMASTEGGE